MMLCGLWHGAGWQYIGFGVLMSSAIVISRLWGDLVPEGSLPRRVVHAAGPLIMMWFLFVNWIVFRAVSWDTCMEMFSIFFFLDGGGTQAVETAWLALFAACALVHTALYKGWFKRLGETSDWSYAALYGAAAALCVTFMATEKGPGGAGLGAAMPWVEHDERASARTATRRLADVDDNPVRVCEKEDSP